MSRNPDTFACPTCDEEAVLYPDPARPEATAHCTACDTAYAHVYDCEMCGGPFFTVKPWDMATDGPIIHLRCAEQKFDSH